MGTSLILDKSFDFALDIVSAYEFLIDKKEFVMSKQLLKSGTSIGANMREAEHAQSRRDFLSKTNIALKEANETEFWIELLLRKEYLGDKHHKLLNDCIEINKILHSIVKTTKASIKN